MNKKLAVVVIVLVLSTGVIPGVISSNPSFGTTIYVDDDNIMGPWDGSKEHPFQFIQDGVDNTSEGDTVFVYSGTYYENAIVDKAINLIGENKEATIIDGNKNGNVIHIIADEVTISDFTLQHYGTIWSDSGIKIESDDNTITNT